MRASVAAAGRTKKPRSQTAGGYREEEGGGSSHERWRALVVSLQAGLGTRPPDGSKQTKTRWQAAMRRRAATVAAVPALTINWKSTTRRKIK